MIKCLIHVILSFIRKFSLRLTTHEATNKTTPTNDKKIVDGKFYELNRRKPHFSIATETTYNINQLSIAKYDTLQKIKSHVIKEKSREEEKENKKKHVEIY